MGITASLKLKIMALFLVTCLLLVGAALCLSLVQNKAVQGERNRAVRQGDTIALGGTIEHYRGQLDKVVTDLLATDELYSFLGDRSNGSAKMVLDGMFLSFQERGIVRFLLYAPDGQKVFEQSKGGPGRDGRLPDFLQPTYAEAEADFEFHYYYRGSEGAAADVAVEYCLVTVVTDDDDKTLGFAELALDASLWLKGVAELTGRVATLYDPGRGSLTVSTDETSLGKLQKADIIAGSEDGFSLAKVNGDWLLTDILPLAGPDGEVVSLLLLSQDAGESVAKSRNALITIVLVCAGVVLVALSVVYLLVTKGIIRPIGRVIAFSQEMAAGCMAHSLEVRGRDEVAQMGVALNEMAEKIRLRAREAEAISTGDLTTRVEVTSDEDILGTSLEKIVHNIGDIIRLIRNDADQLTKGSAQVAGFAAEIGGSAEVIRDRSLAMSRVSEEIAEDMELLASATEEMSASVREISENTSRSKEISTQARLLSGEAGQTIGKLNQSSGRIAEASGAISDFADQTNLLALNATIEAARAGDAGKGFAVVAAEVKELANQSVTTARAISDTVGEIRDFTGRVVEQTGEVAGSIDAIDEVSLVVSAALEEQSKVADELSATINSTSGQVKKFALNISDISASINANTEVIAALTVSAEEMAGLANRLKGVVDRFSLQDEANISR